VTWGAALHFQLKGTTVFSAIRSNARILGAHVAEVARLAWKAIKPIVVEVAMIVVADLLQGAFRPRSA
jgi:hypothetical protein